MFRRRRLAPKATSIEDPPPALQPQTPHATHTLHTAASVQKERRPYGAGAVPGYLRHGVPLNTGKVLFVDPNGRVPKRRQPDIIGHLNPHIFPQRRRHDADNSASPDRRPGEPQLPDDPFAEDTLGSDPLTSSGNMHEAQEPSDASFNIPILSAMTDTPQRTSDQLSSHQKKKQNQWDTWKHLIIPRLKPLVSDILMQSDNGRYALSPTEGKPCTCNGRSRTIQVDVVRFDRQCHFLHSSRTIRN